MIGVRQFAVEPRPRKSPKAIGGPAADSERRRSVLMAQPGKVSELNESCRLSVVSLQLGKRFVEDDNVDWGMSRLCGDLSEADTSEPFTVFEALLATCALDENAAHAFGRSGEKVTATVPVLCLGAIDKSDVGFVNEGCWLEGMVRGLLRHAMGREPAQFDVDEWQQVLGCRWVAGFNLLQYLRDFVHRAVQDMLRTVSKLHGGDRSTSPSIPVVLARLLSGRGSREPRKQVAAISDKPTPPAALMLEP